MRELATSKLALAYRLDEVAASVATMQSASALDTVAMLVLARNPANTDAKYVKFFHEKIPSRMMAECTPLTPLNEIVANEPGHAQAAVLRTRALTRIFKDDHVGAIADLTESLAICRLEMGKQRAGRDQLVTMTSVRDDAEKRRMWTRDWVHENKVAEEEQPRGMEMQLLFQRGNQYLTLACQYARVALEQFKAAQRAQDQAREDTTKGSEAEAPNCKTSAETEAYRRALEAREAVRKHAKRALRDYTTFLSHLDYAHAPVEEVASMNDKNHDHHTHTNDRPSLINGKLDSDTTALVRRERAREPSPQSSHWTTSVTPTVYDIPTLLTPSPPTSLPPFPPIPTTSTALALRFSNVNSNTSSATEHQDHETLTYHPLLPETLHALLLAHALLQTPPTTLFRISNNVARLARLADGYPFFLSARSPARADWAEILRKTGNWVGLSKTWEGLMKIGTVEAGTSSASSSTKDSSSTTNVKTAKKSRNQNKDKDKTNGTTATTGLSSPASFESAKMNGTAPTVAVAASSSSTALANGHQKGNDKLHDQHLRDRIHKEAVIEALGDERVVDDDTFQRAVEARERRAWREMKDDDANGVDDGTSGSMDFHIDAQLKSEVIGKDPAPTVSGHIETASQRQLDPQVEADMNGPPATGVSPEPVGATLKGATTTYTSGSPTPDPTPTSTTVTTTTTTAPTNAATKLPKPPKQPPHQVAKDEEYLIGTERASAIAAWILDAPATVDVTLLSPGAGATGKGAKGRRRKKVGRAAMRGGEFGEG